MLRPSLRLAVLLLPLGLLPLVLAGPAVAEPVAPPSIAYEAYELPNGLRVMLHVDRRLPVAGVNLWYYVGAKDELPGRTGFAHLFEHLMFMGTDRVPNGQYDRIMEAEGGSNNASTSLDRTNYFESGPSQLLPTLLWLEAERMESMGPTMTQEKLALQQSVVREERRQNYEIAPYGPAELAIYENMYPRGHPYRHSVIGTHEDIQAATVQDVKDFHRRFHVPNNAALVVAGDFDPVEVRPLIARLFGSLPRGEDPHRPLVPAVDLGAHKRVTVVDGNVELPRLDFCFHSPAFFAEGDAVLDLVAAVLTEGKTSRLYKRLVVDTSLATSVSAWQGSAQLGSIFQISVTAAPGASLQALEKAVWEEVERLAREEPRTEELQRPVNRIETQKVASLESLAQRADLLNHYLYWLGEPDGVARDLERYRRTTVHDVKDWAARILKRNRCLLVTTLPTPEPVLGSRDERPAPAATSRFDVPQPEAFTLPGGLRVWHVERPGLPLVSMRLEVDAGAVLDPVGKSGLATLAHDLLDEGAGGKDAFALTQALDDLGAHVGGGVEREGASLTLDVLARNLEPALALYASIVSAPALAEADFARIRAHHLAELEQAEADPTEAARRLGMATWYGADHPYGWPIGGARATLGGVTLEDCRAFVAARWRPSAAVLLTGGAVTRAQLEPMLTRAFAGWKDAAVAPRPVPGAAAGRGKGLRVVVKERPAATQTVLRVILPGVPYGHADRLGLEALNTLFGASFTSRLNANLREAKGWTYGAGSSFGFLGADGAFVASSSLRSGVTGPAVSEVLKELAKVAGGDVTAEEAQKASATNRHETVQGVSTLAGLLAEYGILARYGRAPAAFGEEVAALNRGFTADELNALARRYLAVGDGVIVLVGDSSIILPQLETLKLPKPEVLKD
jgi:zinc protease